MCWVWAAHCRYSKEWQKTVERIGRWIDFDNGYKTLDPTFMESVWWVFSTLHKKGLVYQGFKVTSSNIYCAKACSACCSMVLPLARREHAAEGTATPVRCESMYQECVITSTFTPELHGSVSILSVHSWQGARTAHPGACCAVSQSRKELSG